MPRPPSQLRESASTLRVSFDADRGNTGLGLAGEALELASVESGWAEFDQLMHAVCAGAEALVRLQIPVCNESYRASLTKSVQDLQETAARTAELRVRAQSCAAAGREQR